ncbi:MAG: hypothetical protein LWW85_13345 [Marinilabiliales bacterium]|nr:hypothetical protein [Marinilabiliales bacterium]
MWFRPILLLLLLPQLLQAQHVRIWGDAPDYSGKEIRFYTYPEPVSHRQATLGSAIVGRDGRFDLSFSIDEPIEVYADLEKFKGTLVVEPNQNYEISLPSYSPRSAQEAASPYFTPELYWLKIHGLNEKELNFRVRAFQNALNRELEQHTADLYRKKSSDTVKAIISRLDHYFPTGSNRYFEQLKRYSYGTLEAILHPAEPLPIALASLGKGEKMLAHPAFQRLFNSLFSEYLTALSRDIRMKDFIKPALRGNFEAFCQEFMDKGFDRASAELIAVKSFYDGFFAGKFDKAAMLNGVRSATSKASWIALKNQLPTILERMSLLQQGSQAPTLPLKTRSNGSYRLSPKGKYTYLAFFRSDSRESVAELDSLVSLDHRLREVLTVIPVALDDDPTQADRLWKSKNYPWILYTPGDKPKAVADYQLRAVPTFCLLSPDLRILLPQALSPSHNFESLFLKIFRENRIRPSTR